MGAGRLLQQQRLAVRRRHGYSGCLTRLCASQDQAARTIRSSQNSPDTRTPPDHRRLHHLGLRRDQPPPLPRHDLLSQKFVRHARYDHRPALHPKPSGKTAQDYDADVPLRCLLPKGLEGILTTGLGASAHRDAMPVIRMQPCLQNQGYAVGYLSALCVKENKSPRKIDIKKVQRHLVKIGNLPERVLTDKEFKGFSNSEMKKAIASVTDNYKGLEILLTDPERCIQLASKQIAGATMPEEKVILASILCILGQGKHAPVLAEAIRQYKDWDEGWHYTGMGQFGMCLSRLDALITALGNARDTSVLPTILEKAKKLEPEDYLSHFRAITMATEAIGSREAVSVLLAMLTTPGVRGHSILSFAEARSNAVPDLNDTSTRNLALKELHLARALYLCGDQDGIGEEVLRRYADGLQGHYARYAQEILNSK